MYVPAQVMVQRPRFMQVGKGMGAARSPEALRRGRLTPLPHQELQLRWLLHSTGRGSRRSSHKV